MLKGYIVEGRREIDVFTLSKQLKSIPFENIYYIIGNIAVYNRDKKHFAITYPGVGVNIEIDDMEVFLKKEEYYKMSANEFDFYVNLKNLDFIRVDIFYNVIYSSGFKEDYNDIYLQEGIVNIDCDEMDFELLAKKCLETGTLLITKTENDDFRKMYTKYYKEFKEKYPEILLLYELNWTNSIEIFDYSIFF